MAGGVVGAAAVLTLVTFAAVRGWADRNTALAPLRDETTDTGVTTAEVTTSIAVQPIEVEFNFGTAIIAKHIMCVREDDLSGDSVEAVRAAIATDNDNPDAPGGTPKPYAHDAQAQNEIVRASIQELHDANRFYTDCKPVPAPAIDTTALEDPLTAAISTLPISD